MNDLAQFLLARYKEAEDYASYVASKQTGNTTWAPPWTALSPKHVLADLASKRLIVADVSAGCGPSSDVVPMTLALLALPYADHPDYREEWKP